MGWIMRLGLLSGLVYIGIILALHSAFTIYARPKGSVGIYASRPMWIVLFAVIWSASFGIAYLFSPLHHFGTGGFVGK